MTAPKDRQRLMGQVVLAQAGDRVAFEEVFRLTVDHARKLAYSLVGPNLCDDVLQESYLLVYRKLHQLKDPRAFIGWLCRLVLHVAYRQQKSLPDHQELPEALSSEGDSNSLVDSIVLRRALSGLHQKDRDVLALRELLGLSYEDISQTLQVPVGTVRSRLNKARQRLAERLKSSDTIRS